MGQYEEMLFAQMVPYLQWKKEQPKIEKGEMTPLVCKHVFWGETPDWKELIASCDVLFVTGKAGFVPENWEIALTKAFMDLIMTMVKNYPSYLKDKSEYANKQKTEVKKETEMSLSEVK